MTKKSYTILVVEDDFELRSALVDILLMAGYNCLQAEDGQQALMHIDHETVDLVITDHHMPVMDGEMLLKRLQHLCPELPVLMVTAYGSINGAVAAMQMGAVDYLPKPFEAKLLIEKVRMLLPDPNLAISQDVVAEDPYTKRIFALAKRLAQSDATVMLLGESGTGKEVLAHYIHRNSPRKDKPFVAINCAAIPETMLESLLFGYEKGAFTGAFQARSGKFEQANGGTLLLDEISEMDVGLQAKLLRVLQEREVERIGAKETIALNVRIIATSNRRLEDEVAQGRFREDLYYRLNVFPVKWKPLRERPLDILPLAERFIRHYKVNDKVITLNEDAKQAMMHHPWPGNIRELENVIQRALILCQGEEIVLDDLMFETDDLDTPHAERSLDSVKPGLNTVFSGESVLTNDLKNREYHLIVDTLKSVAGHKNKTAEILGISPRTLRYKIARMRENGFDFDYYESA